MTKHRSIYLTEESNDYSTFEDTMTKEIHDRILYGKNRGVQGIKGIENIEEETPLGQTGILLGPTGHRGATGIIGHTGIRGVDLEKRISNINAKKRKIENFRTLHKSISEASRSDGLMEFTARTAEIAINIVDIFLEKEKTKLENFKSKSPYSLDTEIKKDKISMGEKIKRKYLKYRLAFYKNFVKFVDFLARH